MKNVYSLGAYQVDPNNFRLDIWYNNPLTSIDINYIPKTGVDDKLLIQLLDLDRLNQQQQMYQDGLFDFVPITANQGKIPNGGTINPRNGRLYFTTVEPFGKTLKQKGATLIKSKLDNKKNLDLKTILKELYKLGVNNLLVEGGDKITKNFLRLRLFNKFLLIKSSTILSKKKKYLSFTSNSILNEKYGTKSKILLKLAKDNINIYKR